MSYFAPVCGGGHGRRVLLGDRAVDALHPVPGGGVALDFTCSCGWAGTLLPDGRTLARAPVREPVPAARGGRPSAPDRVLVPASPGP